MRNANNRIWTCTTFLLDGLASRCDTITPCWQIISWQGGDWTHDTSVNSRLLYQLSYMPIDSLCLNDAWENWTHASAVKGRCLNHLTNAPYPLFVLLAERWQGYTKIESKGVLLCASFEAVGIAGFEPTTSPSQAERSAKLSYIP